MSHFNCHLGQEQNMHSVFVPIHFFVFGDILRDFFLFFKLCAYDLYYYVSQAVTIFQHSTIMHG